MNRRTLVIVLVLLSLGFVYLGQNPQITGQLTGEQVVPLRFAYAVGPYNAIPMVALRQGFLQKEGLKVEEVRTSFIGYVFQQVSSGQIDALVGAETPAVFAAFKKVPYRILATHEENTNDLILVARREANIRTLSDLRGKKVGLPLTSVAHYGLWRALTEIGVDPSKVTFVDLSPQNMASALEHGDVDAIFIFPPVPSLILAHLREKVTSLNPPSRWMMNVYVSQGLPLETQEKLLRAFLKAEQFIQEHPQQAKQIVAKETGLDLVTLESLWPSWNFHVKEFTAAPIMTRQAEWAIQSGFINHTGIPDFSSLVDSRAIKTVSG